MPRRVSPCRSGGFFARGGDVLRARLLEDVLRAADMIAILRVDRDQDVAAADLALVTLRLVLGDTHPDERTDEPARRSTDRRAAERGHDRSSGDERAETRYRERADADEPAGDAAEHA